MKNPRSDKTEMDLTVPVILQDTDDCFGKEWNPQDKDCSLCADLEICGIKYQSVIKKNVKEFETKNPVLDMASFEKVDMQKVLAVIKKHQDTEPVSFDELEDMIIQLSRVDDRKMVQHYLKTRMAIHNIILSHGLVKVNEETTITPKRQ